MSPTGLPERGFSSSDVPKLSTFPAPLVLPEELLALDEEEASDPQTLKSWIDEPERNTVTPGVRTVYIAAPPNIGDDVTFLHTWEVPVIPTSSTSAPRMLVPTAKDICAYLAAFLHPLPVKLLPTSLSFVQWPTETAHRKSNRSKQRSAPSIAVHNAGDDTLTLIRSRSTPSQPYTHQLSVSDLIDALVPALPADAYALLLLVNQDLFEDADDDFICGRAYGGSRVAVVSSARYHPGLDTEQELDRTHAWPASHCESYVRSAASLPPRSGLNKEQLADVRTNLTPGATVSPLRAALNAHLRDPVANDTPTEERLIMLWTYRTARTATHELLHCFGLDHCVFAACLMQGTAGMAEDLRQPPYVCFICALKVGIATEMIDTTDKRLLTKKICDGILKRSERERCLKIADVCATFGEAGGRGALRAWMLARARQLEDGLEIQAF